MGRIDIGVLTVVVALLAAWSAHRALLLHRAWGPDRSWAAGVLVLALVLLVTAAGFETRHQWVQARATGVVQAVSGVPGSSARCQRFTADLVDVSVYSGFVSYDSDVAQLRRSVCNDLAGWVLTGSGPASPDQVRAVHVLVHEAMHVAGEFTESRAECTAMQHDAAAAELLGASPQDAAALASAYYADVYPLLRDDYRSGDCAPDAAGDLTPGDGRFP